MAFTRNKGEMTGDEAFARLSTLCAKGEHSTGEMRQRMMRWGIDADTQQQVVDALVDARFVDDTRYARMYVDDKLRFDHWGPRKIAQGLMLKGVDKHIIDNALATISVDAFDDILLPLLKAKARTIKGASAYERRCKLIRFAVQRGFMPDMATRHAASFFNEAEDIVDEFADNHTADTEPFDF